MRKSRFCPFPALPHPFFYASSRLLPSSGFPPRRKVENFAEKDHSFADKTDCFLPRKEGISGIKSRKKYSREKMHHDLAQPRAKRHTPTWTNVPEACTTDSIIYRKINSTTKGTSYPQKEPSPLGWAISPKKKKRARKNKNDRFSTQSRGCGAAEPTTQAPPLGGEGGTEGRERAKRWEENRQSHKKRAKRKACAEKTVNLQANRTHTTHRSTSFTRWEVCLFPL